MDVNGKFYPMWGQFIEKKNEWIGGELQEVSDSWPPLSDEPMEPTKIKDIVLKPNGKDSAYFEVEGEDYTCGGDVGSLGIAAGAPGWITLSGYGGHTWRIKKAIVNAVSSQ